MGQFYKIHTHHGSMIAEENGSDGVFTFCYTDLGVERRPLHVFVSNHRPDACFFISSHGRRLVLSRHIYGTGLVALGLATGRSPNIVSLFDPCSGHWACATPLFGDGIARGTLLFERRHIDAYERYTTEPVDPLLVPPAVIEVSRRIDEILLRPGRGLLTGTTEAADVPIIDALGRLTPLPDLAMLAASALSDKATLDTVLRLYPDDVWAQSGLTSLATWRNSASRSSEQTVGTIQEDLDCLSAREFTGPSSPLPLALVSLARQTIAPRRDLCILSTARNEGLYILEWLAYHRAIGVEAVFLYTNDNDDGSDALLAALAAAGVIHWTRNVVGVGNNAQLKAYTHALSIRPEVLDYRWAMIIDLDEYLAFDPNIFSSFMEFLKWHDMMGTDVIALNWILYHGHADAPRWSDEFLGRRFPFQSGGINPHIKTICRPNLFIQSTPHFPLPYLDTSFEFRSNNGAAYHHSTFGQGLAAEPNANFAWINHYLYKSAEEFLIKWSRNRGDHPTIRMPTNTVLPASFVRDFVHQFEAPTETRASLDDCAPEFATELSGLMALPGVLEAWHDVQRIYQERVRTILPLFVEAPGILEAGEDGEKLLNYLSLR